MKELTIEEKKNLAKIFDIDFGTVSAVLEVESNGVGFLQDGRVRILFEAHHFSRLTGGKYNLTHPHISSEKWNKALYKSPTGEWIRLNEAMTLDKKAALQSASYGLGQIMGFNYSLAGYADVETMVIDFSKSEFFQFKGMLTFIKNNRVMYGALRNKQWALFASLYNGKRYKDNKYDTKLAEAYGRHSNLSV